MIIQRNFRQATAILSADLHLMEKGQNPPCRLDDYFQAQTDKMRQIKRLQKEHDCPFIIAGDIFDHWKPSPELINHCHSIFPKRVAAVAGNHDLPQHNIELLGKSGFQTLCHSDLIYFLANQTSWKTYDESKNHRHFILGDFRTGTRSISVAHILTWKDEKPFPGCKEPGVDGIFDMFPDADLIVTGDNHKTFTARRGHQLLINPGSLLRRRGDQIDHRPCVFLWFADSNSYQIYYLKIDRNAVTRQHLDDENELRQNKELFLGKLDNDMTLDLSFKDGIKRALDANHVSNNISKYILKWAKL